MRAGRIMVGIWVAACCLQAQQGSVAGPLAGFVFDSGAHVLRPILGIPGAASFGGGLEFGVEAAAVAVSPRQDSAIVTGTDNTLHLFRLRSGSAAEVALNGITVAPERVVYSPAGTAAALYGGGRVQVVTGLPAAPAPGLTFDLTGLLAAPQRGHRPFTGSLAVSDDGTCLLAAGLDSVQVFAASGAGSLMPAHNALAAFAPGAHDAAIVDAQGAGVILVRDVSGAAAQRALAGPDDLPGGAVGVAFSADGGKLYIASSAGQGVAAFDLASGNRANIGCACAPGGISAMGSLFRLNEFGAGPLWLLDPAGPGIVFVPALSSPPR
jgi:DNA-binding beta-propeller fold protein YncE